MRIDFSRDPFNRPDEQSLIRFMRGARAVAAAAVIGGIALVAVTSGPAHPEGEGAGAGERAAADAVGRADPGLLGLEAAPRG